MKGGAAITTPAFELYIRAALPFLEKASLNLDEEARKGFQADGIGDSGGKLMVKP